MGSFSILNVTKLEDRLNLDGGSTVGVPLPPPPPPVVVVVIKPIELPPMGLNRTSAATV